MIMAVAWTDEMATGVEMIDKRNKEFFQHFAKFVEVVEKNNRYEIGRVLDSLAHFAMRHFAEEELCMEKYGCHAAEANKLAHEEFLTKLDSVRERFAEHGSNPKMAVNYCDTLGKWLVKHITEVDTQIRDCVTPSALASSC
jgi:hemerythrin